MSRRSDKKKSELTRFEQELTIAVASLREGEVVSFGDIAARAGRPNAPRAAGSLLSKSLHDLPWWRVVRACGDLPPCNPDLQTQMLQDEGVTVVDGRVRSSPFGRFAE